MNIGQTINKLYPTLEFWSDFEVFDEWNWQELKWYNTEITEPTTEELETAWVTVEAEILEEQRQANIRQDIADTIIEFTTIWGVTGKFKIRKKDFAPVLAQFMDVKENSVEPINVLDYYYTPIPFVYQDFLDFKALISDTQTQILINNP